MGSVTETQPLNMKIFVAIAFLVAVAECRRHLCDDGTRPKCPDGSKAVYNRPTGQGFGLKDKPFPACADGSKCGCPGGGKNCQFRYKVCDNGQSCRTQCRKGVPHCPWATKNRNKHNGVKTYNSGDNRPGNKGHNWGPDFAGNKP